MAESYSKSPPCPREIDHPVSTPTSPQGGYAWVGFRRLHSRPWRPGATDGVYRYVMLRCRIGHAREQAGEKPPRRDRRSSFWQHSRSFFWQQPELPRITLVQSFGEHGDGYAKDMRWTLARLRSGWRIKAVRAEQTTSGCFQVRRPDRQLTTMEGLCPPSYAKRPTCLKSPESPY